MANTFPEVRGAKVLLMGGSGSGKTYSCASLAECGLSVRYVWLEEGYDSTARYFMDRDQPIPANIAWVRVPLVVATMAELVNTADVMNTLSFAGLANWQDPNKSKHRSFHKFLGALCEYVDERTGKSFGSVDEWGPDTVLVVDSFSALTEMALTQLVGHQPLRGPNIIGVAQQALSMVLHKLTSLKCHVVLTAHIEREVDELAGGTRIFVSTVGRKLAPKVPNFFSDVIHAKRDGSKFSWATNTAEFDLKSRLLPITGGLDPTFHTLIARWKSLSNLAAPSPTANAGNPQ